MSSEGRISKWETEYTFLSWVLAMTSKNGWSLKGALTLSYLMMSHDSSDPSGEAGHQPLQPVACRSARIKPCRQLRTALLCCQHLHPWGGIFYNK